MATAKEIVTTPSFEKELKALNKKYSSIRQDYTALIKALENDINIGDVVFENVRKIRLPIKSKGKGKSKGGRVITIYREVNSILYLLSIYDKSDKENITDKEIKDKIKAAGI